MEDSRCVGCKAGLGLMESNGWPLSSVVLTHAYLSPQLKAEARRRWASLSKVLRGIPVHLISYALGLDWGCSVGWEVRESVSMYIHTQPPPNTAFRHSLEHSYGPQTLRRSPAGVARELLNVGGQPGITVPSDAVP